MIIGTIYNLIKSKLLKHSSKNKNDFTTFSIVQFAKFCKTAKLNGTKLGRNIHFLDEVDLQGEGLIGCMKREFK
jgi:hypothetical protein